MEINALKLSGTYEIILKPSFDERGYFMRVYDEALFKKHHLQTEWPHENQSLSIRKNTLRGLHFQRPPHAETKLVRVITGSVVDVFVDLRNSSPTYGQWDSVELSAMNHKAVYIPKGFAHGFCTLTSDTVIAYKVDIPYAPAFEGGLRWNDSTLRIQWPADNPHVSPKDGKLELFSTFKSPFA
jgi:dTDP-4-dehydrorhamnose 3,5-epimerase